MLEFGIVNFWVYVLGAFAVIIAPGPNSLFVLKTAVTEGRRPALAGALAVLVGDSVLITCSFVGVAAMLAAHPDLFMWVRTAGGLYLAWLGFKILYSVYGKKEDGSRRRPGNCQKQCGKTQCRRLQGLPHGAHPESHQPQGHSLFCRVFRAVH